MDTDHMLRHLVGAVDGVVDGERIGHLRVRGVPDGGGDVELAQQSRTPKSLLF